MIEHNVTLFALFQFKSQVFQDNKEVCCFALDQADIFNRYGVDYFLSGTALAIHPDYRKHGIATEMLKSRINILKCLGLEVTSTGFSSIGAQKAAKRSGFVEDYAIRLSDEKVNDCGNLMRLIFCSYEELSSLQENWDFRNSDGSDKYSQMSLRLQH